MGELKHKKYNKLKPEKAYTPPHMPQAINIITHKVQVNLIYKVWEKKHNLYRLSYIVKNKLVKVHRFRKVAGNKAHRRKLCVVEYMRFKQNGRGYI